MLQCEPIPKTHSIGENMKRMNLEPNSNAFCTSHSGLVLAGACINRHDDLGRQGGQGVRSLPEVDILRSYFGWLCLGPRDYQAITTMGEDDYFKKVLGIGRIASIERLRQRVDEAASDLVPVIARYSRTMLKRLKAPVTGYRNGLVPLDAESSPRTQ